MLAENAAELHRLEYPQCGGIHAFPCGDHFHVGHMRKSLGLACRAEHEGYHRGQPPGDTPPERKGRRR